MFAKDNNGTLRLLTERKIIGPRGEQVSRQILDLWSAAELKAWNIYPMTEDAVPEGKREVSRSLVRMGDTVNIAKVLEDIPGAVPHAIGENGTVTATTIRVPDAPPAAVDIFPSSLTVGKTYDPKDVKYDKLDVLILKMFFQVHNRVRVLEGQPAHTAAQFKTFVKNQMT